MSILEINNKIQKLFKLYYKSDYPKHFVEIT